MKTNLKMMLGVGGLIGLFLIGNNVWSRRNRVEAVAVTPVIAAQENVDAGVSATGEAAPSGGALVSSVANTNHTEIKVLPEAPLHVVTHTGGDFKWGMMSNVVAAESLHLAEDAESENGFMRGVFVSQKELGHQSFATLKINYLATIPSNGSLKLELNLMDANNVWTDWQEVGVDSLNKMIPLERAAAGWQYRLTFSAPESVSSPHVESVTVTTQSEAMTTAAVEKTP